MFAVNRKGLLLITITIMAFFASNLICLYFPFFNGIGSTNPLPRQKLDYRYLDNIIFRNGNFFYFSCEINHSDNSLKSFLYQAKWNTNWEKVYEEESCIENVTEVQEPWVIYSSFIKKDERKIYQIYLFNLQTGEKSEIYQTKENEVTGVFSNGADLIAISQRSDKNFRGEELLIKSIIEPNWNKLIESKNGLWFQNNLLLIDNKLIVSSDYNLLINSGHKQFKPQRLQFTNSATRLMATGNAVFVSYSDTNKTIGIVKDFKELSNISEKHSNWHFAKLPFYFKDDVIITLFIADKNTFWGNFYRIGFSCDQGKSWTLKEFSDQYFGTNHILAEGDDLFLVNYKNIVRIELSNFQCN
ncbi:hypothetical protein EHQ27_05900 [Leptospira wolffii]|uniref:hypothetical protein n=1 Tax=Leptospira wolffii TaxID=409998 RepID=UPI00108357D3|nr:hypothetical protein [Leptospira wolffii]TGK61512.1 hypothetical protein EHQ32_01225 [Leptospira wolffii]TGK70056.1 hypothetical protein EHQ35_16640 [Leptospira wolffii]TGK74987.1 hypothetical protein EHQ27_05900 [Leptospira wolffii]TGL31169.1 hypothetical protein EHQ57_07170 [Leptospira wolffii]